VTADRRHPSRCSPGGKRRDRISEAPQGNQALQPRPGIDGLLLPQICEVIAEPDSFPRALKQKAGLAEDHWSRSLRLYRLGTESFGTTPIRRAA